ARPTVPMLAGQRIRMQQVRRRAARTAPHSRPTLTMTKQVGAIRVHTMGSTAPEKKKELAMLVGEELLKLTRQP
ncbi:hypothetical protein, partial [uncultured Actinomyces sp.]|uniref:hypothetical protein n=1 Tax=uncultured Actinomyces sp. TaxID=249061 RepID=UPI0028D411B9